MALDANLVWRHANRFHHHHHSLSPFLPGTHVCYKALPQGYSFLDANAVTSQQHGLGIVEKTELIEPGRVEVLIDVFHLVKLESCPGQVFDRVWFCPRDLGISINGDPQKRIDFGNHGALPPIYKSASKAFST